MKSALFPFPFRLQRFCTLRSVPLTKYPKHIFLCFLLEFCTMFRTMVYFKLTSAQACDKVKALCPVMYICWWKDCPSMHHFRFSLSRFSFFYPIRFLSIIFLQTTRMKKNPLLIISMKAFFRSLFCFLDTFAFISISQFLKIGLQLVTMSGSMIP